MKVNLFINLSNYFDVTFAVHQIVNTILAFLVRWAIEFKTIFIPNQSVFTFMAIDRTMILLHVIGPSNKNPLKYISIEYSKKSS